MQPKCVDQVVGGILAGWRYDISGLAAEMRQDYERHFVVCAACRNKQRQHRTLDIGLIVLASLAAVGFLITFAAVRHYHPPYAMWLQAGSLAGFALSFVLSLMVAVATPAPVVITGAALVQARRLHERLPANVRDRIPQDLLTK